MATALKPKPATKTAPATQPTDTDERKFHKVNPDKVQKNDLMALTYWVKIKDIISVGTTLQVDGVDEGIGNFKVDGKALIANSVSADQYSEEVKLSKTKICEILVSSYNRPFTVCFTKQDGSERVLRGRLIAPEPIFGRSRVEDLDLEKTDKEDRMRLVTHLTVRWLVVDGVKYTVK